MEKFNYLILSIILATSISYAQTNPIKDAIKKQIEDDFKSGRAQKMIQQVKDTAAMEQPLLQPKSMQMADRMKKYLAIGKNIKTIDFIAVPWDSLGFDQNSEKSKTCLTFGAKLRNPDKFYLNIQTERKLINKGEINLIIKERMPHILTCDLLRVTVMPKYPHRATFHVIYDKTGKITKQSEIRYWQ